MKNLFLVINKEKIYAYVVSILTIAVLFFMSSIMNTNFEETELTSSNIVENQSINSTNTTNSLNNTNNENNTLNTNTSSIPTENSTLITDASNISTGNSINNITNTETNN